MAKAKRKYTRKAPAEKMFILLHSERERDEARAALRLFIGCAYPVSKEINPRGHAWRPEESLDYALSEAKSALGRDEQTTDPDADLPTADDVCGPADTWAIRLVNAVRDADRKVGELERGHLN